VVIVGGILCPVSVGVGVTYPSRVSFSPHVATRFVLHVELSTTALLGHLLLTERSATNPCDSPAAHTQQSMSSSQELQRGTCGSVGTCACETGVLYPKACQSVIVADQHAFFCGTSYHSQQNVTQSSMLFFQEAFASSNVCDGRSQTSDEQQLSYSAGRPNRIQRLARRCNNLLTHEYRWSSIRFCPSQTPSHPDTAVCHHRDARSVPAAAGLCSGREAAVAAGTIYGPRPPRS
jgi:hypothetical protein